MRLLTLALVLGGLVYGQTPNSQQVVFNASAPSAVTGLTATPLPPSQQGRYSYNYWIVATYVGGVVATTAPVGVRTDNPIGNSAQAVNLSWQPSQSATSYTILRSLAAQFPGTTCNACAVVVGTTGTTFTDNVLGSSLTSYNGVVMASPQTANIAFDIVNHNPPALITTLPGITPFVQCSLGFTSGSFLLGNGTSTCPVSVTGLSYIPNTLTLPSGTLVKSLDIGFPGFQFASNSITATVPLTIAGSTQGATFPQGTCSPVVANTLTLCAPVTVQAPGLSIALPGTEYAGVMYFADNLATHRLTGALPTGGSTSLTPSMFALSAGWGSTASVAIVGGNVQAFSIQVTSNGTGQASNPIFTFTYPTTLATIPHYICGFEADINTGLQFALYPAIPSVTSVQFVYLTGAALPVAGKNYVFNCSAVGWNI